MTTKNLLIELGTEELPPKALRKLAQSLHDDFTKQLHNEGLNYSSSKWYATPRRLALYIADLDTKQQDREIEIKGPATKVAFDANGNPSKAALGWASANGITIDEAQRLKTEKGEWLYIKTTKPGAQTASLIPDLFIHALKALPIPRLMHWGDKHEEFVRPVHTLCVLLGDELVDCTILGVKSSKTINGHRFLGQRQVTLQSAETYVEQLRNEGSVVADCSRNKLPHPLFQNTEIDSKNAPSPLRASASLSSQCFTEFCPIMSVTYFTAMNGVFLVRHTHAWA